MQSGAPRGHVLPWLGPRGSVGGLGVCPLVLASSHLCSPVGPHPTPAPSVHLAQPETPSQSCGCARIPGASRAAGAFPGPAAPAAGLPAQPQVEHNLVHDERQNAARGGTLSARPAMRALRQVLNRLGAQSRPDLSSNLGSSALVSSPRFSHLPPLEPWQLSSLARTLPATPPLQNVGRSPHRLLEQEARCRVPGANSGGCLLKFSRGLAIFINIGSIESPASQDDHT